MTTQPGSTEAVDTRLEEMDLYIWLEILEVERIRIYFF
jgi:hypothetical protein